MRNVNAARSAPAAVSTIHGMNALLGRRVEVVERLAGRLAVAGQVEVAPVVDALELLPAEREAILDVDRLLGVVGELVGGVLAQPEPARGHAVRLVPGAPAPAAIRRTPRRPRHRAGRSTASPSARTRASGRSKLPGLISLRKLLPIWAIPNGIFLRRRLLDVLEVDVGALGRLGPQVDDRALVLDRSHVRLEHQVEPARRRQRPAVVRADQPEPLDDPLVAQLGRRQVLGARQLVEPVAAATRGAFDERVAERPDVTRGDPHLGVHEDARRRARRRRRGAGPSPATTPA